MAEKNGQAGAEIEVTPEMIQAGVDASFEDVVWDEDCREVCVEAIIRAALIRVHPVLYKAMKDAGISTENVVEQEPLLMWADPHCEDFGG